MKNFLLGIVCALAGVVLLGADGGYNFMWQDEMKRPEAQRAVAEYIESHCTFNLYEQQSTASTTISIGRQVRPYCWSDSPKNRGVIRNSPSETLPKD
jgi:hypothetical protein